VGVAATFGAIASLPEERRAMLAVTALREPYAELQLAGFEALARLGRAESVVRHFPGLLPPVRERMASRAAFFLEATRREAKSPRDAFRKAALEALVHLAGPGALPELVGALQDPVPAVRDAAAALLEALGSKALYHLVSFRMHADPESRLFLEKQRAVVESSLGPVLREYASHGKRAWLEIALEIDPLPEALLAETALARRDSPLWGAFVEALSASASERALVYLLGLYGDPNPRHRAAAEEVFARRRDPGFPRLLAGILARKGPDDRSALAQRFREFPWWPAVEASPDLEAASALQLMDFVAASALPREARDEKLLHFRRSPYPGVRVRLIALLQNLGSAKAGAVATASLGDPSDEVKLAAARAVIALGLPDRARLLLPLLGAEGEDVRKLVQREIAASSFEKFLRAFDRMDPGTRETAARALAKIDARILDRLSDQVASLDPERRLKALRIVDYVDAEKDLRGTLMELLSDPDRRVRATALKIVKLTENSAGLALLMNALSDPDRRVRANAIEAFEDAEDPSCVPVILPYVNDPDNRVRANAAKALAVFGRPEGRSTLEAMLRDADESMRLSAAWALGQVRLEGARAILEERSRVETIPAVSARIAEALAALAAQPAAGGPA
jgi:HEAT repeat protein